MKFPLRLFGFMLAVWLICLLIAPTVAQEEDQGPGDQEEVGLNGEDAEEPEAVATPTATVVVSPTPEQTATALPTPTPVPLRATATPLASQTPQTSISGQILEWNAQTWGPEHSTAGTRLRFEEVARARGSDGFAAVDYRVGVSGVLPGVSLSLFVHRLGRPSESASPVPFRVNDAGALVWADSGEAAPPLHLFRFMRGEPLDVALVSADGGVKVFGTIVPFPIEATGTDSCRLAVELILRTGTAFKITGVGFEPNEELEILDRSENELIRYKTKAGPDGTWRVIALPAVTGKSTGTASFETVAQKCSLKVTYRWGTAALDFQ